MKKIIFIFVLLSLASNASSLHSHIKISSENSWFFPSLDSNDNARMSSCPINMYPQENGDLNDLPNEFWKTWEINPIYQISNLGRVKSIERKFQFNWKGVAIKIRHNKEKIICQKKSSRRGNYFLVVIYLDRAKKKTFFTHILVAKLFVDNPERKPNVNHIDGDKFNNKADNLEWVTPKENSRHAAMLGLMRGWPCTPVHKINLQTGKIIESYPTIKDAGLKNGISVYWVECACENIVRKRSSPLQDGISFIYQNKTT